MVPDEPFVIVNLRRARSISGNKLGITSSGSGFSTDLSLLGGYTFAFKNVDILLKSGLGLTFTFNSVDSNLDNETLSTSIFRYIISAKFGIEARYRRVALGFMFGYSLYRGQNEQLFFNGTELLDIQVSGAVRSANSNSNVYVAWIF